MKGRLQKSTSFIVTWIVLVSLWVADVLIWVMLRTRSDERRIRPTERVVWPKGLKQRLMRRQDNTCVYCGYRRIATSLDIDHIIPVVRGGSNDMSNLQVICRRCNQRKGLQTDEEFRTRYASPRSVDAIDAASPPHDHNLSSGKKLGAQARLTVSNVSGKRASFPSETKSSLAVLDWALQSLSLSCSHLRRWVLRDFYSCCRR